MDKERAKKIEHLMIQLRECNDLLELIEGKIEEKKFHGFAVEYYISGFPTFRTPIPQELNQDIKELIKERKEEIEQEIEKI